MILYTIYLQRGIPPCADLKKNTMETSLNGDDIGQWSDALFPSTAITSTICAIIDKKNTKKY